MRRVIASRITRTTLNIDDPVLTELEEIQRREGKSLGALVTELVADALARRRSDEPVDELRWTSKAMRARVDLDDQEAVQAVLDASEPS